MPTSAQMQMKQKRLQELQGIRLALHDFELALREDPDLFAAKPRVLAGINQRLDAYLEKWDV